jgi:hypothetical protein
MGKKTPRDERRDPDADEDVALALEWALHVYGSRYVSKWRLLSRLQLQNHGTVAATSGLRSRAAAWYKHARTSGDPIKPA